MGTRVRDEVVDGDVSTRAPADAEASDVVVSGVHDDEVSDASASETEDTDHDDDVDEPGRVWPPGSVGRALALAALVAVVYASFTFVQVWRASSRDDVQAVDAILVLGAAQYDGRPSPVLERRLQHALLLYRQGVAPRIVVTGGRQMGDTYTEATSGYLWLRDRGVPDDAILKEVDGRSTYESLRAAARFLLPDGLDEVVVVSDGYHALRAAGTAAEVGFEVHVSVVPTDGVAVRSLARETAAVAAGRVVGYGRLTRMAG